jgi:hypothetical protein
MRVEEQLIDLMKQQIMLSRRMDLRRIVDDAVDLTKCARRQIYGHFSDVLQESGALDVALLYDAIDDAREAAAAERLAEAEAAEVAASPEGRRDRERQRLWAPYGSKPPWEHAS